MNPATKAKILFVAKIVPNKIGAYEKFMVRFAEKCHQNSVSVDFMIAGEPHPEIRKGLEECDSGIFVIPGWEAPGSRNWFSSYVVGYLKITGRIHYDVVCFQFAI